jgi:hypothetical protein
MSKYLFPFLACRKILAKYFCGLLPLWLHHRINPQKKKKLALNLRQGQFWWYNSLVLSEEHELTELEAVAMPWLAMKLWPGKVWWYNHLAV